MSRQTRRNIMPNTNGTARVSWTPKFSLIAAEIREGVGREVNGIHVVMLEDETEAETDSTTKEQVSVLVVVLGLELD